MRALEMFGALALVSMRQQQYDTGGQIPFVFSSGNELVDDHLRAISEISELRLPSHQCFRIVTAVTIFKSQNGGFR